MTAVGRARWARRAVAAVASAALLVAGASTAWASTGIDGEDPGAPLSLSQALLLYVGAPLAIFAAIALLVYLPSLARGPRYRPGREWNAEPVWVNGPPEGTAALAPAAAAATGHTPAEAGAGGSAVPGGQEQPARGSAEGGASARW